MRTRRWLRALGIAKVLFEAEGYHTLYLEEIEQLIQGGDNVQRKLQPENQRRFNPLPLQAPQALPGADDQVSEQLD